MKQIFIFLVLTLFLSGCAVHFVPDPYPVVRVHSSTVRVIKHKPKVVYVVPKKKKKIIKKYHNHHGHHGHHYHH
jgi:uncharacterized protein YceK